MYEFARTSVCMHAYNYATNEHEEILPLTVEKTTADDIPCVRLHDCLYVYISITAIINREEYKES